MLQQHLLRELIQIVTIWKTVVIGSLIVEWTCPNGTSTHTWGTNLRTFPLHIPYKYPISPCHTSCGDMQGDVGVCGINNCAHACAEV